MKDNITKRIIDKIALVFFVLWLVSLATNVLGRYEYKETFLFAAFSFWVLGSFVDGLTKRRYAKRRISVSLRKGGTTLFGIWVLLLIFEVLGWLGAWWEGYSIYALWLSLLCFSSSVIINSIAKKRGYWQIRSIFYTTGMIIVIVWAALKYTGSYVDSQDAILIGGIALLAIGFVIGASKKEDDFEFFVDVKKEISEKMREVPDLTETAENVMALDESVKIGQDPSVTIKKGALSVDIYEDERRIGTVYFGEGSYKVATEIYTFEEPFMGYCYSHGAKWEKYAPKKQAVKAEQKHFDAIGLTKEDIKELAIILSTNDSSAHERIDDVKARLKSRNTEITLPFMKIIESKEGEYVKIGPLEVVDLHDKGSRIRFKGKEFVERNGYEKDKDMPSDLVFKIFTTDGTTTIVTNNGNTHLSTEEGTITVENDLLEFNIKSIKYIKMPSMQRLEAPNLDIIVRKEKKVSVKIDDFKLKVQDDAISMDHKGRHIHTSNVEQADTLKEIVAAHVPYIIKDVLNESSIAQNQLMMQLIEELD